MTQEQQQLIQAMIELLDFDLTIFLAVNGAMVLSFLSGHFLGRVVRIFGKL